MLKFLRKYNKWILVIGGSLLMVAFLAPQAVQQCGFNPANRAYARIEGQKISEKDFDLARRQYTAIEQYFPLATAPIDPEENVHHWLLLAHAADKAGYVGESADGYDWATGELARAQAQQFVFAQWQQQWGQILGFVLNQPQYLQQFRNQVQQTAQEYITQLEQQHELFASRMQLTPEQLDQALSKTRGIWRMLDAYTAAARLSDKRAQRYSDEHRDEAYMDAALIPPAAVIDQVPEPTEEQIAAQFEAYKSLRPGEGEYAIGYTLPARVKLSWLTISREAITERIRLDPIEVRKRWQTDRETYPGEFDVERPRVERTLTNQIVDDALAAAQQAVQREVLSETSRLDERDDGTKILPEDWEERRPNFADVAQAVVDHVREATKGMPIRDPEGLTIPLPEVTVRAADFLTQTDLSQLPGIGRAVAQQGPRRLTFPQLALGVRELDTFDPDMGSQVDVPIAGVRLQDGAGNLYFVTMLDARKESPPDSIDEIREQLVTDYKEIQAYQLLQSRVEEFRAAAVEGGLDAIEALFPVPAATEEEPSPLGTVQRADQIQVGTEGTDSGLPALNAEAVRDVVLAIAEELDPLVPAADVPISDRLAVVAVPAQRSVAVVEVVGLRPLTRELFRSIAQADVAQALSEEFRRFGEDRTALPFAYDRLAERLDFKIVARRLQQDAPAPPKQETTEETAEAPTDKR